MLAIPFQSLSSPEEHRPYNIGLTVGLVLVRGLIIIFLHTGTIIYDGLPTCDRCTKLYTYILLPLRIGVVCLEKWEILEREKS